jgi:hypothetical protein
LYEICPDLCAAVESEINRRGEIILGAVDYEKIFQSAVRRCPTFCGTSALKNATATRNIMIMMKPYVDHCGCN